jgi:hypothetical protein
MKPPRRSATPNRKLNHDLAQLYIEPSGLFHRLVKAAGLDRRVDFRNRDLRWIQFAGADLRGFDFSQSDLRGTAIRYLKQFDARTNLTGARLDPEDKEWLAALKFRSSSRYHAPTVSTGTEQQSAAEALTVLNAQIELEREIQDKETRRLQLEIARTRALANSDDGPVRELLAKGLLSTLVGAKAEDDLTRRDALLDELRALAHTYPDDAPVRELLAKGLLSTLVGAKAEDDLTRRDVLLDELRTLAHTYPHDAPVREQLAKGLLVGAKAEDDLTRRDALLDELRTLAHAYPDDALAREILGELGGM